MLASPLSEASPRSENALIQTRNSLIHGRGVYAKIKIDRDTRIVEYTGERITKSVSHQREDERVKREREGKDASVYIFNLNKRHDLDGRISRNVARLINHCCLPNCRAQTIRGRIWIIAKREISSGDELTFDYGFPYREWLQHPCRCGAKGCVGYIVDSSQRWRVRRQLREMRSQKAGKAVAR